MNQALSTIFRAGLVCGVLDITAAFITWGPQGVKPAVVLRGIASGLLGARSFAGGWETAMLGAACHFLIAFSAAAVFYAGSRKFAFMNSHPVSSGILYGVVVYMIMYWIVMPLSHVYRRPFSWAATIVAIVTHIACVGTPISLIVRYYSK